jgi:hypothetical protein
LWVRIGIRIRILGVRLGLHRCLAVIREGIVHISLIDDEDDEKDEERDTAVGVIAV